MSLISLEELLQSGDAEATASGLSATRVFQAVATSPQTRGVEVLSYAAGFKGPRGTKLPAVGSIYPNSSLLRCRSIKAARDGDNVWTITCQYDMPSGGGGSPSKRVPKPWLLPPYNITIGGRSDEQAAFRGYDKEKESVGTYADLESAGVPVLNSAGDFFDPPVMVYKPVVTLSFSYNVKADSPVSEWIPQYLGSTNFVELKVLDIIIPVRCGLITDFGASYVEALDEAGVLGDGYDYFKLDISIDIYPSPDGAVTSVLDRGFYTLEDGKKWPIKVNAAGDLVTSAGGKSDSAVSEPQLLDGSGGLHALASEVTSTNYLKFLLHPQLNWELLNLPENVVKAGIQIGEKFK